MQGTSGPDRELLDATAFVSHLVPEGSAYAFLAEHRHRLFPEMSLRVYGEPATDWLLLHSRVDEASNGHVATRVDIWDEQKDLIATSAQLARYGGKPIA